MSKVKKGEVEVEVTIHILNGFSNLNIYVGDGTLDKHGYPHMYDGEYYTLVHTSNGNETITLMVEEGSYISIDCSTTHTIPFVFYYTSLDSTIRSLMFPIWGGNIHITENMEIYYDSEDWD